MSIASAFSPRRKPLVFVIAAAFGLRAMWLFRSGSQWTFTADSPLYLALADGMRRGCGFAPYAGICGPPEVLRTPGYPVFLIPFGDHYRLIVLAQAVIGAFVCWLVARFVTRCWGSTAGLITAAFVAVDLPTILVAKAILAEALFQAIATLGIFASLRQKGVVSGLLLGISALVRPVGLVLVPVAALAFGVRRNWRGAGAAMAVAMLVIGGWCARNYREIGVFTLSVEGEWNLYWYTAPTVLARHDRTTLLSAQQTFRRDLDPMIHARNLALPESESAVDYWGVRMNGETSRFLLTKSLSTILDHPIDAAVITLEGLVHLTFAPYWPETGWHGFIESDATLHRFRIVTSIIDGAILLMVWAGILQALARAPRDPVRWILLCAALVLVVAAAPFSGNLNVRFRSPAIPFLAVLAGIGWAPKREAVSSQIQEVAI